MKLGMPLDSFSTEASIARSKSSQSLKSEKIQAIEYLNVLFYAPKLLLICFGFMLRKYRFRCS